MLRLIKLAVYAGAAFAIYEIVQGMLDQEHLQSGGSRRGASDLNQALNSDSGRMQALTGPGLGQRVETLDSTGESMPHQVGRGVLVQ